MLTPTVPGTRKRLYNSTGFFFLTWAAHYLPFYLMARQLFLHHYLPAHVASSLVTGALVEFICSGDVGSLPAAPPTSPPKTPNPEAKAGGGKKKERVVASAPAPAPAPKLPMARERLEDQSQLVMWGAAGAILAVVVWSWWFFLPITYGRPGLDVAQVQARKWLGYDLHFAK